MNDDRWAALRRPTPDWFRRAPLGIFVHWGAYSVPAWAEPTGELGAVDDREWFVHNSYAEWYANTIRIEGSPAQRHHEDVHGGAPYDDFLDDWTAERFDAGELLDLVARAGADYVVPTTKHHDGIALWDAPGTGSRNTVHRGPRRDLVGELRDAAVGRGVRFGVYYSGGLDWHVRPMPPHLSSRSVSDTGRPKDAGYAAYAHDHVRDLVDRYAPDILWNDIEWPDAGKHFGEHGLGALFEHFYAVRPEGVVNDRWGATHHDYGTSEYQSALAAESEEQWENTRGIGLSFGYNEVEGPEHCLDGPGIARHLTDVVSRGGRLLLNVGPRADGTVPENQRAALEDLGRWMAVAKPVLVDALASGSRTSVDGPVPVVSGAWVRLLRTADGPVLAVDAPGGGSVELAVTGHDGAVSLTDWAHAETRDGGSLVVRLDADRPGPALVRL